MGRHTLNWDLVQLGGYKVKSGDDHMSVEIPLYSPGMTYEVCLCLCTLFSSRHFVYLWCHLVVWCSVDSVNHSSVLLAERLLQYCNIEQRLNMNAAGMCRISV